MRDSQRGTIADREYEEYLSRRYQISESEKRACDVQVGDVIEVDGERIRVTFLLAARYIRGDVVTDSGTPTGQKWAQTFDAEDVLVVIP